MLEEVKESSLRVGSNKDGIWMIDTDTKDRIEKIPSKRLSTYNRIEPKK